MLLFFVRVQGVPTVYGIDGVVAQVRDLGHPDGGNLPEVQRSDS